MAIITVLFAISVTVKRLRMQLKRQNHASHLNKYNLDTHKLTGLPGEKIGNKMENELKKKKGLNMSNLL